MDDQAPSIDKICLKCNSDKASELKPSSFGKLIEDLKTTQHLELVKKIEDVQSRLNSGEENVSLFVHKTCRTDISNKVRSLKRKATSTAEPSESKRHLSTF